MMLFRSSTHLKFFSVTLTITGAAGVGGWSANFLTSTNVRRSVSSLLTTATPLCLLTRLSSAGTLSSLIMKPPGFTDSMAFFSLASLDRMSEPTTRWRSAPTGPALMSLLVVLIPMLSTSPLKFSAALVATVSSTLSMGSVSRMGTRALAKAVSADLSEPSSTIFSLRAPAEFSRTSWERMVNAFLTSTALSTEL
uniref:Uncharacterized protein n=1 Tax=Cacopsylla melanoneura TaxID=428564 RepID=A0A8D8LMN8_9HEMI